MSKAGPSPNIPEPGEKRNDSPQNRSEEVDKNTHDRLLDDIAKSKHIPELAKAESRRDTLLDAILNNKTQKTLAENSREFRVLGLNFMNRSVYMGLSRQLGQIPFLALFKGEMKDNLREQDIERLSARLASKLQKDKQDKEEKDKKPKEADRDKDKTDKDKRRLKIADDKDLLIEPMLEEKKPERIPNQDQETEDTDNQYNIVEKIQKATEFELSNLSASEHQNPVTKDLERSQSHDLGSAGAGSDNNTLSIERLKECITKFSKGKILVVGDLLIDELMEGKPERISREAPVLILEHVDTELIPGGAANAAHNVTALGGQCHTIGVCGKDEYAGKLAALLNRHHITHDLIVDESRPTTVKTRILSKTHALMQQLLRLDRISHDTINSSVVSRLIEKLTAIAQRYPVLVLSDYRAGLMTDEIIHACQKLAATHQLKLIVDAQDNFERFQNVGLITPNQPDTEKAVGYKIESPADLLQAGRDMLLLTGAQAALITRGKEGMVLFEHGESPFFLPAFNRSEIYDVSGAGDTVVATVGLALATGASMPEAVTLGNIAASIVVKKPGTAVTSQKEMLSTLNNIDWLINQTDA